MPKEGLSKDSYETNSADASFGGGLGPIVTPLKRIKIGPRADGNPLRIRGSTRRPTKSS
jgi:hypothetical protein